MAETSTATPAQDPASQMSPSSLPRVTIRFCTQCKWMLRAAYFAQELLSTFSTSLGEVALQPATGGVFIVEIFYSPNRTSAGSSGATSTATGITPRLTVQQRVLWDRKTDGGFPETKELKRRVRDIIEPGRNLGHVDQDYPKRQQQQSESETHKEPKASNGTTMPNSEQQQKQPLGPRWPHMNTASSEPAIQREGSSAGPQPQRVSEPLTNTNTQTEPDTKTSKQPSMHPQQEVTSADGPVYDPRMPGGGVKPVVPPVALSSRYTIQESPPQSQPQQNQEYCEDCQ
ncbi:hypothetical protein F5Y19DRAFT_445184 [Xylariaceae sp. FL1651]|nr:hypothetical protein F5Y19DRAFT_445184 [Xylariaceae sp. FL1651]